MGIDLHALRLLQYVCGSAPLRSTVTLGRQGVHVSARDLKNVLKLSDGANYGPYCENLLRDHFGASDVDSIDASEYENATVIHDMNRPIGASRQYDTVVDFGTLEHIFNVPQALNNIASLCNIGGRIIHALPANNYNGHGFWQFSPELFFSLYNPSNGFQDTEIFIANVDNDEYWWRPNTPTNGVRVEFTSASRSYVLVVSRKTRSNTTQNVQQSDYLINWDDGFVKPYVDKRHSRTQLNKTLRMVPLIGGRLAHTLVPIPNSHVDAKMHALNLSNHHYTRVPIETLVKSVSN